MKKFAILATLLLSAGSLFAGLAVPGELEPYIAKTSYTNDEVKYSIEKIYNPSEPSVNLIAKNEKGEKVWESESIGDQEKAVKIDGKIQSVAVKDLDGDGCPEILAGGMNGPNASFLYVFRYKQCCKGFEPIAFEYPEYKFSRDFLVSDLFDPKGNDVIISNDGKIQAAGKIYTRNGPVDGYYYFEMKNGKYECTSVLPQSKVKNKK